MTPDTKVAEVTPEVREAVLSTIQHEAYRTLAGFIMDGLTLEQIQSKVGFDELQYKSMVDHIAKISAETVVAEPTPEDAPTTVTPAVTSETPNATNVPVEGAQTGVGQIQANATAGDMKEVVASTGNDAPTTTAPATENTTLNAPEASQPASTATTEELTA